MTRSRHSFVLAVIFTWVIALGGCGREPEDPEKPVPTTSPSTKSLPATRPSAALPAGASCVTAECHASYGALAAVHAPVAQGECKACHEETDAGGHRFPLKRDAAATCTFCHSVTGSASHQHKALEQGCGTCHDPHASATKFLLKSDSVEHLCLSCHQVPLKRFAHRPFAQGQCTLCHQPHEADNAMLLRGGEGEKHCFTCHGDLRDAMASARQVHPPAMRDCQACHAPHATDQPHLLAETIDQTCTRCHEPVKTHLASASVQHQAMRDESSCLNCHAGHLAEHRPLMKMRMDQTCLTCHDKPLKAADGRTIAGMKPVLTESKFLHGAIRAGDCSACHDAHGAQQHALLTRAFPRSAYVNFDLTKFDLCFTSCHSPELVLEPKTDALTNFRDGDRNLHYLHVNRSEKGRSCTTCHSIHGSNLPNHMASEVPFERSGWAMPIEFEKLPDGGSCAPGCHVPQTYSRTSPSTAPTSQPTTRDVP